MFPPFCLTFYTCSYDNVLKEWNTKTGQLENNWGKIDETDQVRQMLISPEGHFIYTSHRDHTVKQWSVEFKKCMHTFRDIHTGSVDTMAFSPCGTYLYTAGRDMKLNKLSVKHQKSLNSWDNLHPDMIMRMTVTPSGKYQFTSSHYTLKQWKPDGKNLDLVHDWGKIHTNWITSIVFTPDIKYFYTSSLDNTIKMWDRENQILYHDFGEVHTDGNLFMLIIFRDYMYADYL